jgi:DNA polymerase IV (archaeal DinB-like DNA polymerase)
MSLVASMQRAIALIDMDYFFAQCEQIRNPSIKDKPVVIVMPSLREGSGAVATANYRARALKIKSGMPLSLAKKLSNSETIFINADKEYYQEMSDKVFEIVDSFCEKVEQVSIDEAYVDLTSPEGFFWAEETCIKIKRMIFAELGLTCSIGLSINKFLAKMAASEKKPDGFFVVKIENVNSFLLKQSLKKIPGVGPKTEKIMQNLSIKSIVDLKEKKLDFLISNFGEAKGTQLFYFARGIDEREIISNREKQQLSRMMTIEKDSDEYDFLSKRIDFLCERVYQAVKLSGKNFKTVSLIIVNSEMQNITRSKTIPETISSSDELKQMVQNLLSDFLKEKLGLVRRVGVKVSNFNEEKGKQKKLFEF